MDSAAKALADKISGEVVFAENPGKTLKKWRLIFEVSQKELAAKLNVSPSVISDYEGDRRKSPGIAFVRKIIEALLDIDRERGYRTVSKYRDLIDGFQIDVILDMKEYDEPVISSKFRDIIDGEDVTNYEKLVNGHTIVDSLKAIVSLNSYDFYRLYGFTTERALIFTKVSTGRSPMVAVRVANLKPAVVVLHSLKASQVDKIAAKIADIEKIHLIATEMPVEDMVKALRRYVR
ncbi:helix-turn-helix domain-containing protein [Archaeoglobus veneficus]|uniref:Transcriptional regulator, XRE family n=1 Tax=Archaeoglobus veneficus (strain DSM 11195 / SNP6) TaxID=693661 RepID=F2KS96_ARCVS|nr:helix-turn-helix domain-containing protein [Archaeoglobus veneficus]AEA48035.1 transcriptional regulator, XRE family [Archaeoglobus veneficus SNP6]